MWESTPPLPAKGVFISGIKQQSTSPLASAACVAIKPDCLPISRTKPIPFFALRASIAPHRIALIASSTAVWNPKVRSRSKISLSMVLGMPTMAVFMFRARHIRSIASAPAWLPLPPMTNRKSRSIVSMESTISPTSDPPRELPKIEPPFR